MLYSSGIGNSFFSYSLVLACLELLNPRDPANDICCVLFSYFYLQFPGLQNSLTFSESNFKKAFSDNWQLWAKWTGQAHCPISQNSPYAFSSFKMLTSVISPNMSVNLNS